MDRCSRLLGRDEGWKIGVGNGMEKKGMRRHRCAGRTAVFHINYMCELLKGDFVSADVDECAHDGADHVAQKTVGCDDETPAVGRNLFPAGMRNVTDVGLDVGVQFGK